MKTILSKLKIVVMFVVALVAMQNATAQAPQKMSYQAVVRSSNNELVVSKTVSMRISILQGSATGTAVYVETQTPATNANGLISLEIGGGTVVTGTVATINWAAGPYYIKTETDPTGGTAYSITGTNEFLSVPYALYSLNSASGATGAQGPIGLTGAVGATGSFPSGTAIGDMQYWNGSNWVMIPVGSANQVLQLNASKIPVWSNSSSSTGNLPTVFTNSFDYSTILIAPGGNVLSDGGAWVSARGVCWGTSPNPVATDSHTVDGTGFGTFTSKVESHLLPNTIYYFRAYATNSVGTGYGEAVSFNTQMVPGLSHQGGIVAYVDGTGLHGLIAASSDQSGFDPQGQIALVYWHGSNSGATGAAGTAIGTGNANTNAIVGLYGAEINAARICYDLVIGGYSDWYLPSKDELEQLHINQAAIGGFAPYGYWSSSEFSISDAWGQNFDNGNQVTGSKSLPGFVRAVRSF